MPYTIHFMGLACFVKQDDGNYLVAMPDGRNATSPGTTTAIEAHSPVVIVRASDILNTSDWPNTRFTSGLATFDIADCVLNFQHANVPGQQIDATQFAGAMFGWSEIDDTFTIDDKSNPHNVVASAVIRRGTLRAYRIPGGEAMIGQVDVPIPQTSDSIQMTATPLCQGNGDAKNAAARNDTSPRQITFKNDSEIVVANVSDKFRQQRELQIVEPEDANHFFIYYVLNTSAEAPNKRIPQARLDVLESASRHPFIKGGMRDLHAACSPMQYPG
jgi:hypothetical protein